MEYRAFGQTDMKVSALGFGGSEIGGAQDAKTVDALLGSALDAGLNLIDTAECYGRSEELIGQVVSHRRSDYYLFSKCGHASGLATPDWDVQTLRDSIDRSLKRLRTDYLDLLQLHSCSLEALQQGDVIEVLQRARDAGKVRYIGYSGDNEAALYAVESGVFDSLQTSINVADQSVIDKVLPAARDKGMGVIAKRPIANVAWQYENTPENSYYVAYWERLQELQYGFTKQSVAHAVSIALRFTLSVPGVTTAIVGTTNPGRWQQNADLVNQGPLDAATYDDIRARWNGVAKPDWVGRT
ncbi:aldo/keto reductase [Alicyclobacillus fastidiosus]|uniref:Aldo/keto reductase n=1 Tax=Alicyclobacillus fastidiosus TaxID=392011 RepID=A0ABY6ZIM3_9BACL|nr:aldo/keto reductase [Alicyclobacillus fastidiosus]WAH42763.1 aldo/keto reductase [Alicyclobacillus fastidiosus]GMA64675.1 aldo/keto reductase [Alicyclobacillus fastidiosus]